MSRQPFEDVDPVRRRIMASIRGRDTKPELLVRSTLHRLGYRYTLHPRHLPGRPDIVFPRRKVAIWVHGCFWHQHHGCPLAHVPRTREGYWGPKLARNVERDKEKADALRALGWHPHVVWECELQKQDWLLRLKRLLGPPSRLHATALTCW